MPTYDYVCKGCEHAFEAFQSMSAKPLKKCPSCGKMQLKRLIGTGAGVIFKGSGFYETDYRSDSYKKAAESEKNGGGSEKSGESASSGKQSGDGAKQGKASNGAESKTSGSGAGSSSSSE